MHTYIHDLTLYFRLGSTILFFSLRGVIDPSLSNTCDAYISRIAGKNM
jgi:hypothetical protein